MKKNQRNSDSLYTISCICILHRILQTIYLYYFQARNGNTRRLISARLFGYTCKQNIIWKVITITTIDVVTVFIVYSVGAVLAREICGRCWIFMGSYMWILLLQAKGESFTTGRLGGNIKYIIL